MKSILLVEEDDARAKLYTERLANEGYENIVHKKDLRAARKYLQQHEREFHTACLAGQKVDAKSACSNIDTIIRAQEARLTK